MDIVSLVEHKNLDLLKQLRYTDFSDWGVVQPAAPSSRWSALLWDGEFPCEPANLGQQDDLDCVSWAVTRTKEGPLFIASCYRRCSETDDKGVLKKRKFSEFKQWVAKLVATVRKLYFNAGYQRSVKG